MRKAFHSFPVVHSVPTNGFIFREKLQERKIREDIPRSFAYCADTVYTETIIPFIQNCDLLIHETTFMQEMAAVAKEKWHSTTIEAATIAEKSHVKKLVIGHFSARYNDLKPLLDEARTVFPETYLAEDGNIFQV